MDRVQAALCKEKTRQCFFKWLWRLDNSNEGGWKNLITTMYWPPYINGLPLFKNPISPTWTAISSIINTIHVFWQIDIGCHVVFWECFPFLYTISTIQSEYLAIMGEHNNRGWMWKLNWSRSLNSPEQSELQQLYTLIDGIRLDTNRANLKQWKLHKQGGSIYS